MPSPSRASLSVWGAACWWPELKAIPALSLGPRELLKRGASRLIPLVYLPLYLMPCMPGPVPLPVASGPGTNGLDQTELIFFTSYWMLNGVCLFTAFQPEQKLVPQL